MQLEINAINEQFFNRTQNDAIWGLIALFLTNQNAGNTIDFKMNVINCIIYQPVKAHSLPASQSLPFPNSTKFGPCLNQISQKNIFNFTVQYMNNSLLTRQNLTRWGLSTWICFRATSTCSKRLAPETFLHLVAGCQLYLKRFIWRHVPILYFIATNLQTVNDSRLCVDLQGYKSPSIITSDSYRPGLLLLTSSGVLDIVELTVGFEYNLEKNAERKKAK